MFVVNVTYHVYLMIKLLSIFLEINSLISFKRLILNTCSLSKISSNTMWFCFINLITKTLTFFVNLKVFSSFVLYFLNSKANTNSILQINLYLFLSLHSVLKNNSNYSSNSNKYYKIILTQHSSNLQYHFNLLKTTDNNYYSCNQVLKH